MTARYSIVIINNLLSYDVIFYHNYLLTPIYYYYFYSTEIMSGPSPSVVSSTMLIHLPITVVNFDPSVKGALLLQSFLFSYLAPKCLCEVAWDGADTPVLIIELNTEFSLCP